MEKIVLRTYSFNEKLTNIEKLCIETWLNNNYAVEFFTYHKKVENLPENITIRNAEKVVKLNENIEDKNYKNLYFKLKLAYAIGGIIIEPNLLCLRHFDFPERIMATTTPDLSYLNKIADYAILKTPKGLKEINYLLHHFNLIYDDFKKGYNNKDTLVPSLDKIIECAYKFQKHKKPWNFSNSCHEKHWQSQVGMKFDPKKCKSFNPESEKLIVKSILHFPKEQYFVKIYQNEIYNEFPNYKIPDKMNYNNILGTANYLIRNKINIEKFINEIKRDN